MAIVDLVYAKNQPESSLTGQDITLTETWIMTFDEFTYPTSVLAILYYQDLSSYGFPSIGDPNPRLGSVVVTGYKPKKTDSSYTQYIINVDFSNNNSVINNTNNPIDAEPSYSFNWVDNLIAVEHDSSSNEIAILNSAGTPVVLMENRPYLKLTITRNERDYDHKKAAEHIGRVNSSSGRILGKTFAARSMKLNRWSGVSAYDNDGDLYWKVTYEIIFADPNIKSKFDGQTLGFRREFINKGFVNRNGVKYQHQPNTEQKLNSDGDFYTPDEQSDPEVASYSIYETLYESNWPTRIGFGSAPSDNVTVLSGTTGELGLT